MREELTNPLDMANTPFEVELLYPTPSSRRTKDGPRYWVRFEIGKETHDAFMEAHESNLRLVGYLSVLADTDEQLTIEHEAMKSEKSKGPYGSLWQSLFINGFQNCPEVRDLIEVNKSGLPGDVKATDKLALRRIFEVDSLALVGPDRVKEAFVSQAAQRMIEQAEKKVEETQRRKAA